MTTHKHIDRICAFAIVLCLVFTLLFMNGTRLGLQVSAQTMGYEDLLFATDKVHTIDIQIDDWDAFLSTAQSEEYSVCDVTIDGETIKNVGIRGKGNTSLSSVSAMDSERYSFKIEFDQYDSSLSYHGLDKLCLNNLIQDNTYMKDYLVYQMMGQMGVAAPLCSYVCISVNGEVWGLYLAVEAVEESFLQRNYGGDYGELYKPDSMNFGGGRGNGKDFDMGDFTADADFAFPQFDRSSGEMPQRGEMPEGFDPNAMGEMPESMPQMGEMPQGFGPGTMGEMPEGFDPSAMGEMPESMPQMGEMPQGFDFESMGGFGGMGGFGMGSSDVKLQYIDDNPESYSNIFDSAKTDVTDNDKTRLINSLKQLSQQENLQEVVDVAAVLRYFAVHNFVVNDDSYTGSMIHNYYLYEKDGQLSMIPWDYNLAFGTFQGRDAASAVNRAIDEVLEDRPMQSWILSEEYEQQYLYQYSMLLRDVDMQAIIDNAYELISPYVVTDPTAFCTYEEFEAGVSALKTFCQLRTESVQNQLYGGEDVDVGDLDLSAMGTMGSMGGRKDSGSFGNQPTDSTEEQTPSRQEGKKPSSESTRPNQMKNSNSTIILSVVSLLVLAVGLFIAFRFKR